MSADELKKLNNRKTELETVLKEADESLKDLYSLIPFGLAGGLMAELLTQLETEKAYKQNKLQLEGVNDKTDIILGDIEEAKKRLPFSIDIKTRDFYELQIRQLIKNIFTMFLMRVSLNTSVHYMTLVRDKLKNLCISLRKSKIVNLLLKI